MYSNSFIPLLGWCFIVACAGGTTEIATLQPSSNLCTIIDAEKIRTAITQSGKKEILINVYPVKRSTDNRTPDMELAVAFQDSNGHRVIVPGEETQSKQEEMLANYVRYMYSNKIPDDKLVRGFYFRIDSLKAFTITKLNVCTEPQTAYMWTCSNEEMINDPDSAGKCPPDCCPQPSVRTSGRTATPCPPYCEEVNLLYTAFIEKTINDIYRPGKVK